MPTFSSEQRLAIAVGVPTLALLFFLWYRRRQRDDSFDDDDDEDEEEPTVARAFETKIEVQIPKLLVGTVIGRGGANIKQIQRESGAYLRFKDDDENEEVVEFDEVKPDPEKTRTVIIKGERENARKAEFLIKKIISEQPKMLTEEYYVPQRSCGRIIGRGGMTIRHLSKVSGARITIDREEIRPDIPRKCTIVGTADQIANAKGLLDEKIAEHEKFMTRRPPNQMSRSNKKDFDVAQSKETNMSSPVPYTVQFPDTSDFIEVFVSAIDNPEHFYVQLVRTGEAQKLDQLIEAVTEEATSGSAEKFVESIEIGTVCSAPFAHDDSYYRAIVTQTNNDGTVGLYYVDYGDSGTVPKYKLHKLRKEYLQLPFQAIECYLANTRPQGESWDKQASEDFEKLTHYPNWVGLMAKNVKYCGSIPCLDLYDTTTDKDIHINQEMIQRGYAFEDSSYPTQTSEPEPRGRYVKGTSHNTFPENSLSENEVFTTHSATVVDEEDAKIDLNLSGPINPNEFSPIKSALVKRVSKEYINTSAVTKDPGMRAAVDTLSEEKLVQESVVAAEIESQLQSLPEIESESIPEVESSLEVNSISKTLESAPEKDFKSTPEVNVPSDVPPSLAEVSGFGSPNSSHVLKPEVREMIEIEVGQSFETQLTPPNGIVTQSRIKERSDAGGVFSTEVAQSDSGIEVKRDGDVMNISVDSHLEPSVAQATITPSVDDDDDDDDLETFTSTLQKQVHSKKTFVSSVTVTSNHNKRSTVTIVPTSDAEDAEAGSEITHSSKISYAQVLTKSKKDGPAIVNISAHPAGNEDNTVEQRFEIHSKPNNAFELRQEVTPYKEGSIEQTLNHMTQTTNQDKAPIPNQQNGALNFEKKDVPSDDRKSPLNVDSDSETYLSALEEPASDTDTTSYYETAADRISGSTTSLDYLTPVVDTDTDTVRPHDEENGTPVNSDTDDDYDSDDESEAADKTPKRKESDGHADEGSTPKASDSLKMAAKYLSDMDLGYKGDSEDVTESREDLS